MSANTERTDVWKTFRACRLWREASDAAVDDLVTSARIRTVTRGETLVSEGDIAEEFGLVISGRVRIFYLGADGRQITLEQVQSTEPFAVVSSLAGGRYPANAEAMTDGIVALIPRKALFDALEGEPGVARSLIADLAHRVMSLNLVIQTLALDVPQRLARYLFQRALEAGSPTSEGLRVDLGMKKGDLARSLGTVPETLSRAFARLKDDGVLEVHGSTVTVFDVRALATLGSGYEDA